MHVSGESWRAPRRTDRRALLVLRAGPGQAGDKASREKEEPAESSFILFFYLTASPRALSAAVNAQLRRKANKLIKKKGPIQPERLQSFDRIFSIPLSPPSPRPFRARSV